MSKAKSTRAFLCSLLLLLFLRFSHARHANVPISISDLLTKLQWPLSSTTVSTTIPPPKPAWNWAFGGKQPHNDSKLSTTTTTTTTSTTASQSEKQHYQLPDYWWWPFQWNRPENATTSTTPTPPPVPLPLTSKKAAPLASTTTKTQKPLPPPPVKQPTEEEEQPHRGWIPWSMKESQGTTSTTTKLSPSESPPRPTTTTTTSSVLRFQVPDISGMHCDPLPFFLSCVEDCEKSANKVTTTEGAAFSSRNAKRLQSCVVNCKAEFIDTPVPGCIGKDGALVPPSIFGPGREGRPPGGGFRSFQRWWSHALHSTAMHALITILSLILGASGFAVAIVHFRIHEKLLAFIQSQSNRGEESTSLTADVELLGEEERPRFGLDSEFFSPYFARAGEFSVFVLSLRWLPDQIAQYAPWSDAAANIQAAGAANGGETEFERMEPRRAAASCDDRGPSFLRRVEPVATSRELEGGGSLRRGSDPRSGSGGNGSSGGNGGNGSSGRREGLEKGKFGETRRLRSSSRGEESDSSLL